MTVTVRSVINHATDVLLCGFRKSRREADASALRILHIALDELANDLERHIATLGNDGNAETFT